MMKQDDKCVVILSGGLDSSTVAYWARNKGYTVHAITFNYGQIATKEAQCAVNIADHLGIPIKKIDLSSLRGIFKGVTSLCDENMEMTATFSQPIIVPFRNAIFISVAVAYAVSVGVNKILYGAQGSDEPFYPDCRPEFYKSFERAARLGTEEDISIKAPYSGMPKSTVIKEGTKLGVPYHLTWSCYFNGSRHCGKCESCVNRKKAFEEAEIQDPTNYL